MPVVGTVYLNGCNYQVGYTLNGQSVANNTSDVTFYGVLNVTNNYISWSSGSASVWNASTGIGTYYSKGSYTLVSKRVTISHKTDGSYSGTLSGSLSTTFVSGTASGNFSLPKIARLITTTSAPNITDENTSASVTFTNPAGFLAKPYANFWLNGVNILSIRRDAAHYSSPYVWTFTEEEKQRMLEVLPNNSSCTVNFGFDTYNGSTNLGYHSLSRTFTIVNANPTFNAAYLDTNSTTTAITNNNQQLIRNNSTLRINATNLSAKKYATLSSIKAVINGTTYNSTISGSTATFNIGTLNLSSDTTATITLTDSRGLTTSKNLTLLILDWTNPTAITNLIRQSNYYSNTYITVDATYSSLDNKNSISIKTRYKKVSDSTYSAYVTLQDNVQSTLNLDNNYQWNVQVLVEDKIGSTTYNLTVDRGIPIIFFDRGKNSIGINCFPNNAKSLEVEGDIYNRALDMFNDTSGSDWKTMMKNKIDYCIQNIDTTKSNAQAFVNGGWSGVNYGFGLFSKIGNFYQLVWFSKDYTYYCRKNTNGTYEYTTVGHEQKVLYENASGTTGAFTLNETVQNFKYIEVFYHTNDGTRYKGSSKIYVTNENITMSLVFIHYYTNMYTKSAEINLSGTSVTFLNNVQATNGGSIVSGGYIKVHRVVGYR